MRPTRRLSLRGEQLAELRSDEMAEVVAGDVTTVIRCRAYEALTCWGGCVPTLPLDECPIQIG